MTTRLSEGAQKTSSPASCGQARGPSSEPEHANSPMPGATEPQSLPLHLELPLAPEKPMDLQITLAAPALAPELHTGSQEPSTKTSGRPAPLMDGDPSPVRSLTAPWGAPAVCDAVQNTIVSWLWDKQASSGTDHEHSLHDGWPARVTVQMASAAKSGEATMQVTCAKDMHLSVGKHPLSPKWAKAPSKNAQINAKWWELLDSPFQARALQICHRLQ